MLIHLAYNYLAFFKWNAALELLTKAEVKAIIGPQNSNEAKFVAELGGKAHVPILSFSVTSSSLSPAQTPYFIRTAVADSSQLKAITAAVQGFGWHEVVLLYEDTEYGNSFIPHLTDAFQEAEIQLPYMTAISIHAQDFNITKELKKLMTMQTRVFLVHMTSFQLGSRLFSLAEKAGMMSQGYAWIITDGLSNSLGSMDATTIESMEGVLGLRPYSPKSKTLENFKMRWEKNFSQLNIFGLWAYDTVWALAIAVEKIQEENSSTFLKTNANNDDKFACGIRNLGLSEVGPRLLDEILRTRFQGLSGEFKLEDGQLETPDFEIINIIGNRPNGERTIGYWTPNRGIEKLKKIIWPGDSTDRPKGWDIPRTDKKLRVGVPKKPGFIEFVNVQEIGDSKKYNVTGFSIDVFKAALTSLPFELEPEFVPFLNDSGESAGSYHDLVNQLCNQVSIYSLCPKLEIHFSSFFLFSIYIYIY